MSTSTKTIAWSVGGLIVIAGAIYVALLNTPNENMMGVMLDNKTTNEETSAPSQDASNEQIIDYLVDEMAEDDTASAETSLDATTPSSQTTGDVNTNF